MDYNSFHDTEINEYTEISEQKKKMAKIIERSISDVKEQEVLKKLFLQIYDYNAEHIERILKNVKQGFTTSHKTTDIEIKNILVDSQTAGELKKDNSMDYVIQPSHLKLGVFINLPYKELIRNYADKTFQITLVASDERYTVKGKLRRSSVFVKREKLLRNLAEQYNIEVPMIYMPYARKYFELVINDCPVDKEFLTDIIIEGIDSSILKPNCRYFLMWNIGIKKDIAGIQYLDDNHITIENKVTPYFDRLIYKREYIQIQPNQYILFDFIGKCKHSISRNGDRICVYCEGLPPELDGRVITILNGNVDDSTEVFTNYYKKHYMVSKRLRSYADIEYALSCFRDNPWNIKISDDFKIEYQNNMEYLEVIMNYDSDYTYYQYEDERTDSDHTVNLKSLVNCIVTFSGGTYTDDFANYVLDFLSRNYPEFNWQGVIK